MDGGQREPPLCAPMQPEAAGGWVALPRFQPDTSPARLPALLRAVNGQPCPRAEAVLPLRELSYSWVRPAAQVAHPLGACYGQQA